MMKKTVSHEQILIKRDGGLKPVVASALPCGVTAVFRVFIARIYGAYDGVVSVPLEWITFENGHDVFEAEIKVSDFCDSNGGLFFYRYEFKTYYGERYCVSDGFSELSVNALPSERQLLVYDADNEITYSPKGIIYHIFVDRFSRSGKCEIKKSSVLNENWKNGIPEYAKKNGDFLKNNTVFGGDLYGIVEKLDYIKSLGTELIYLSPIFDAYSNHKYDTGDYMRVDESFGGDEALDLLISEAKKRGIGIILDGVFNHTGDDSVYFNRYGNYPDTGAYQSEKSPYYNWYTFRHFPDDYECCPVSVATSRHTGSLSAETAACLKNGCEKVYAAFALMLRTNFPTVLLRQYAKKSRKRPRTAFFTARCGKTLQTRLRIRPVENISEEKNLIPL